MSRAKELTSDRCKTEVKFSSGRRGEFGRSRVFVIVRDGELKFEMKHRIEKRHRHVYEHRKPNWVRNEYGM